MNWNSSRLNSILRSKKTGFKRDLKVVAVLVFGFNFIGLVLSESLKVAFYEKKEYQFFHNFRTIGITLSTDIQDYQAAEKEMGKSGHGMLNHMNTAKLQVSCNHKPLREIYATYNYGDFFGEDPVDIRYGFYDLDIFRT